MKTKEFNLSKRRLDMLSGYKYAEKDVKEFIKWCEEHSHMSEGVQVIAISKLKEGAGEDLK